MALFQYQAKAEPILTTPGVGAPELSWAPIYPDRLLPPRRRSILAPVLMVAPILLPSGPLRLSQLAIEQAFAYSSAALLSRLSQLAVETAFAYASAPLKARVSQLAVEIARPFGCQAFVPPPPPACPADFPTDSAPASRDCPSDLPVD